MRRGDLPLLGTSPFGTRRQKNTATGARSPSIDRSPVTTQPCPRYSPLFNNNDSANVRLLHPRYLCDPRLFANFPRNLAPAFTHYLSERPEMIPQ
jgi:hypothetical protein